MNRETLELFCQKLSSELLTTSLHDSELDRRIQSVHTDLGMLTQMLKLPSPAKLHKVMALRSILRSVLGVRGEEMHIGGNDAG